jgi:hypothetical protein
MIKSPFEHRRNLFDSYAIKSKKKGNDGSFKSSIPYHCWCVSGMELWVKIFVFFLFNHCLTSCVVMIISGVSSFGW